MEIHQVEGIIKKSEIIYLFNCLETIQWHYVLADQNPSDVGSRGA